MKVNRFISQSGKLLLSDCGWWVDCSAFHSAGLIQFCLNCDVNCDFPTREISSLSILYDWLYTERWKQAGVARCNENQWCEIVKVMIWERQSSSSSSRLATERCSDRADRDPAKCKTVVCLRSGCRAQACSAAELQQIFKGRICIKTWAAHSGCGPLCLTPGPWLGRCHVNANTSLALSLIRKPFLFWEVWLRTSIICSFMMLMWHVNYNDVNIFFLLFDRFLISVTVFIASIGWLCLRGKSRSTTNWWSLAMYGWFVIEKVWCGLGETRTLEFRKRGVIQLYCYTNMSCNYL